MANETSSLVHKKITLEMMWDVCAAVACEIETSQGALVRGGLRVTPDPERMQRAEVLTNVCRFIEVIKNEVGEETLRAIVARKRGWTKKEARE